jgi:hypothetical protein
MLSGPKNPTLPHRGEVGADDLSAVLGCERGGWIGPPAAVDETGVAHERGWFRKTDERAECTSHDAIGSVQIAFTKRADAKFQVGMYGRHD